MASFDEFRSEVSRLVDQFNQSIPHIRDHGYDEASLRLEFLDPLFGALGWNVGNKPAAPLHLREVIVENRTLERGRAKRVDYAFRINGIDKWVCEAKKPYDNIQRHYFQAQNYVYNMRLWLGVLSDFEHFIVFVVGGRPSKDNPFPPVDGWRLHYTQYESLAPRMWDLFAKENVAQGSLDQFIQDLPKITSRKHRQGWLIKPDRTRQVDSDFLDFLEDQREHLAKRLHADNAAQGLTGHDLTEATQKIVDRLLFQRICEDRDIDVGRPLHQTYEDWIRGGRQRYQLWPSIVGNFSQLSKVFNGGIFGSSGTPPHFSDHLLVSDQQLEDFIDEISGDDSPYLFNSIPVEILGSVYERFLGSVINDEGAAEQKPDVRKAGGVYYTPEYVVKEVVKQTVGRALEGKTPEQAFRLKIIDPACGSGSFLLGAFERLCQHHIEYFAENPEKQDPASCYDRDGSLILTTAYKRKILRSNIFGTDIDPIAVDVTQMSLCMKTLEDETQQALINEQKLFPTATFLPDLTKNIICGNSIIEPDIFPDFCDADYLVDANPFDWSNSFPFDVNDNKFDVVVGNPPWGATIDNCQKAYFRKKYARSIDRMTDSYIFFLDEVLRRVKPTGFIGFVIPSTILNQSDALSIRKILLKAGIFVLKNLGKNVFGKDAKNTATIIVTKGGRLKSRDIILSDLSECSVIEKELKIHEDILINRENWEKHVNNDPLLTFFVGELEDVASLERARETHGTVNDIILGKIQRGVTPDVAAAHILPGNLARELGIEKDILRPSISGESIKPYYPARSDQQILYTHSETKISKYPVAREVLGRFRKKITCKEVRDNKHPWWRLHRPRDPSIFESPKFIGVTTSKNIELVYDEDGNLFVTDAMYVFKIKVGTPWQYVLAIMQSKAFLFFYRISNQGEGRVIPQVKATKLDSLPVQIRYSPDSRRSLAGLV